MFLPMLLILCPNSEKMKFRYFFLNEVGYLASCQESISFRKRIYGIFRQLRPRNPYPQKGNCSTVGANLRQSLRKVKRKTNAFEKRVSFILREPFVKRSFGYNRLLGPLYRQTKNGIRRENSEIHSFNRSLGNQARAPSPTSRPNLRKLPSREPLYSKQSFGMGGGGHLLQNWVVKPARCFVIADNALRNPAAVGFRQRGVLQRGKEGFLCLL